MAPRRPIRDSHGRAAARAPSQIAAERHRAHLPLIARGLPPAPEPVRVPTAFTCTRYSSGVGPDQGTVVVTSAAVEIILTVRQRPRDRIRISGPAGQVGGVCSVPVVTDAS